MGNYFSQETMAHPPSTDAVKLYYKNHMNMTPSPEPTPSKDLFNGIVVVLHGRLTSTGYTHERVTRLVAQHGGRVEPNAKLANYTHLITTQKEVDRNFQHLKIKRAVCKNRPIVSVNWLIKCSEDNRMVPVKDYLLKKSVIPIPKTIDLTGDGNSQVAKVAPTGTEIAKHLYGLIQKDVNVAYTNVFASVPRHVWNDNTSDKVRALGLRTIALVDKSTAEYQMLENYFDFSAGAYAPPLYAPTYPATTSYYYGARAKVRVVNIYRIERLHEVTRHTNWKAKSKSKYNPRLLWHGSPKQNFAGILRDGLRGDVGERGVFASELAGYSISYSQKTHTQVNRLGMELMLLCECSITRANSNDSKYRDARCIHPDLAGIDMLDIDMGTKYPNGWNIQFEHCVRAEQMRMRYLFQFEVFVS